MGGRRLIRLEGIRLTTAKDAFRKLLAEPGDELDRAAMIGILLLLEDGTGHPPTLPQFRLLTLLAKPGRALPLADIGETMDLDQASVQKYVKQLAAKRWVTKNGPGHVSITALGELARELAELEGT